MAIDRPNVFSNNFNAQFKFYAQAIEASMTLQRVKSIRIICIDGNLNLTSSAGGGNPLNVIVMRSAGSAQDSYFELNAPEGGLINDITITGVQVGANLAQAYVTYILE